MKVDLITQPFLVHVADIALFKGKMLLDSFTVIGRGRSISTNIIVVSRIITLDKDDQKYWVEL